MNFVMDTWQYCQALLALIKGYKNYLNVNLFCNKINILSHNEYSNSEMRDVTYICAQLNFSSRVASKRHQQQYSSR